MDPQLQHPQVHRYGEDHHHQHINVEGEDEQHSEKKSVLKKVKAKAKKIKDTIKKHGHLHGHGHGHDQHDEPHPDYDDEYEDEDEDTDQQDTEVHGAHMSASNQMVGNHQSNLERPDEPTASKDHTRLGVPSSQAPFAPRNTPVSRGEDHKRVAAHDLEHLARYKEISDDSPLADKQPTGEAVGSDNAQEGSYTERLAYVSAALADKVTAAKDVAASKLGYGDVQKNENVGQSDQSKTSYTEKASHAASLLADKAVDVKDAVISKLGCGRAGEHKTPREPVDHEALMQQKQCSYVGKLSGVGSVLADKAVEAKNAVTSKLGGGSGTETTTWTEKLKPRDEDKALSELISNTFYKGGSTQAEDAEHRPVREPGPDAVHKRASEHDGDDGNSHKEGEVKLMGRVTESEEVARRLGTSEEEKRGEVTYVPGDGSPSKPLADMIKNAVSSWWTGGNETPRERGADTSESGTGERRFQESGN